MIKYEFDPQNETDGIVMVNFPKLEPGEEFSTYISDVTFEVQTAMLAILSKTCDEMESYLPGIDGADLGNFRNVLIQLTSGSIDLKLLKCFKEEVG